MTESHKASGVISQRPSARILRAAEARELQQGYALVENVRREAQQLREASRRAYAAEYAQGYDDGKARGQEEAARLISEAAAKVDRYLGGIQNEVVSLALGVVERVLGEFDVGTLVAQAARQAVAELRRGKHLKVQIHPGALDKVRDALDAVLRDSQLGMTVEIDTNENLALGACTLSTDFAVVDASIDAQLRAIEGAIAARAQTS